MISIIAGIARKRIAVGLVLGALASCVDASYRCEDDSECSLASDGRCEAPGYCSYPDDGCESGRRFSRVAGALAERCTDPDGGIADGSTSTGATGDPSGDSGETTTGPSAMCGDAVVEAPEQCDDPDDTLAIGCTETCELAVTMVRLEILDESGGDDRLLALSPFPTGGMIVAGYDRPEGGTRDAVLMRLDADGSEVWTARYDQNGDSDSFEDVVVSANGSAYGVGQTNDGSGVAAFRGRWDNDGNEGFVQVIGSQGAARAVDHTVQATLVVAGGNFSNGQAFAARYPTFDGSADWLVEDAARSSFHGVSAVSESEAFVTGHIGAQLVLARVDEDTIDVRYLHPPTIAAVDDMGQAIARIDDLLVIGGFVTDNDGIKGWLGGVSIDGTPQWSHTLFVNGHTEYEAVAIHDDGRIFAGGLQGGDGNEAFITGHDADGTQRWRLTLSDLPNAVVRDLAFAEDGRLWAVGHTREDADDDGFFAILELAQ